MGQFEPSAPAARLAGLLGIARSPVGAREALASGLGGCVAIATVVFVCSHFVGVESAALLVASMGASAVLLFALPHGPLSQPWPVIGGHVLSAFVGVACARLIPHPQLAAAVAVGAAIGTMQVLRCVHPPGGATALSAVVGGPSVHALGMGYVLTPVLLNAAVIVVVAVVFNGLLAGKSYPAYFALGRGTKSS